MKLKKVKYKNQHPEICSSGLQFKHLTVWFFVVVLSFFLLDRFSISLGDDFGYMFADSSNHACDGKRVTSFAQCFYTQTLHYTTTNGRFLVHLIDMTMLNLVPEWLYRDLNALMFGFLWLFTLRLSFCNERKSLFPLLTLCMIWWLIPDFGTVALSLFSYSINYLWSGVAILGLLIAAKKSASASKTQFVAICVLSLVCGSLQESYSIPLCGAAIIDSALRFRQIHRRQKIVRLMFLIGTLVLVCAPGNIAHFMSGGALASASLSHKFFSMVHCLAFSSISILAAVLMAWGLTSWTSCKKFLFANRILLVAIAVAILFASFTFTASRQLFAPSIFSIILLSRIISLHSSKITRHSRALTWILGTIFLAMFVGIFILRRDIKQNYNLFLQRAKESKSVVLCCDASKSPYNSRPLLWKLLGSYAPDPLERSHFSLPFDGYSRRGLSRIIFGDDKQSTIVAILPYPKETLLNLSSIQKPDDNNEFEVKHIDSRYGTVITFASFPKKIHIFAEEERRIELLCTSDGMTIIVVPNNVDRIKFCYE